jgi:outer membrane lipase/esterase
MITNRLQQLAAAAALALATSTPALAQFSSLTVFGDSLTDSGNNALVTGSNPGQVITGNTYIPSQPYASGTFSNGPTWVNSFAAGIGLPAAALPSLAGGGNYAYGGARTSVAGPVLGFPFSATAQLGQFLTGAPATLAGSGLYVIAIGGNDVRAAGEAVAADPGAAASIIGTAATSYAASVGSIVDTLQARGAINIVVWGVPDVGRSPAALAGGPAVAGTASFISSTFNSALQSRLSTESFGVRYFDVAGIVSSVIASPSSFGFSNVTDACGAVTGCDASTYLFWDGIHPTSAAQQLVANAMLTAVPEPATYAMFGFGALLLAAAARRRRV